MTINNPVSKIGDSITGITRPHYTPETDTKKAEEPITEYWRDPDHAFLRFRLLDVNHYPIQETKEWVVRAPVNANSTATISIQVELLHEDGCSQVIQTESIKPY